MGLIVFQGLLLLTIVGLGIYFLSNRRKAQVKAGVKLGFLLFFLLSIWAVLRPDDLTVIANLFGVTRGTDLLLYALVVAFMFTALSAYLRFRELELRYARLARAVALRHAVAPPTDSAAPPAPGTTATPNPVFSVDATEHPDTSPETTPNELPEEERR